MKKPTDKEINDARKQVQRLTSFDLFKAGVDFALKYNEEQRDIMKVYDIGYEIDMNVIKKILTTENEIWNEFNPSAFDGITDVGDMGDHLQIYFNMRSDYGLHEGLQIDIDDKGRVFVQAGDTPWEDSGFEDELEQAIMTYVTKQKYG